MWFKYGLKAQKLLAQGCYGHKQYALKGQKLLAQGIALGIMPMCKAPCKGKSFTYRKEFSFFIRCFLKLLPLQGARLTPTNPGRCPGLRVSAPSGRAAYYKPYRSIKFPLISSYTSDLNHF